MIKVLALSHVDELDQKIRLLRDMCATLAHLA
jgi:hypothetical protein